ncbi:MAG TPA: hypothetical protein VFW65_05505 [Pseudonocardiaceae bacterium]|nr:hypothetical protein [Pseudonocardiaceae bacterium]
MRGGVCLIITGHGLFVDTAEVMNTGAPAGRGRIINVDAGVTHTGPVLNPGQEYTVTFNRTVANGDQICGQVGNSVTPCATIHS